jgi:hypothetical protein
VDEFVKQVRACADRIGSWQVAIGAGVFGELLLARRTNILVGFNDVIFTTFT